MEFLNRANDATCELGIQGSFVGVQAGVLDAERGVLTIGQAGLADVKILRSADCRLETTRLAPSPAIGVFPSHILEVPAYGAVEIRLGEGDTLLCFSSYLEMARRNCTSLLTTEEFAKLGAKNPPILTDELDFNRQEMDTVSWDAYGRMLFEELGSCRIARLAESVAASATFCLRRFRDSEPSELMRLDFAGTEPRAELLVMALEALELVFRLRPRSESYGDSALLVDQQLADFLETHFNGYARFFAMPSTSDPDLSEYERTPMVRFEGVSTDEGWGAAIALAIRVTKIGNAVDAVTEPAAEPNSASSAQSAPERQSRGPVAVLYVDESDGPVEDLLPIDERTPHDDVTAELDDAGGDIEELPPADEEE